MTPDEYKMFARKATEGFAKSVPWMMLEDSTMEIRTDETGIMNAWVELSTNQSAVYTITTGMVMALLEISTTLCATPSFYSEFAVVGSVHEGTVSFEQFSFVDFGLHPELKTKFPNIISRAIFDDPLRQSLGITIFQLAGRFLMLHEQSHYFRKHLHYLFDRHAVTKLVEILSDNSKNGYSLLRRSLEIDADTHALFNLLTRFDERGVILGDFSSVIKDPGSYLRIISVSAFLVMLLLSMADTGLETHREAYHPSTGVRLVNMLRVLSASMAKYPEHDSHEFKVMLKRLFLEIILIADLLHVNVPSLDAIGEWQMSSTKAFKDPTAMELQKLLALLKTVTPELDKINASENW